MKNLKILMVFLLFVIFNTVKVSAQDESMQKWMDYMTPGEMHKLLESYKGSWEIKMKMWQAPGTEPMEATATAISEPILGGRYMMTKVSGNMMGMPFEGVAIDGYDNALKTFFSTWIDNLGTGIVYTTGTLNDSKKQINYKGKMVNPVTGKLDDYRQDVTLNEDGSMLTEMYSIDSKGNEFKTGELYQIKK